jgi:hypothetical protein
MGLFLLTFISAHSELAEAFTTNGPVDLCLNMARYFSSASHRMIIAPKKVTIFALALEAQGATRATS